MPPDEPNDEERLEELPEDNGTPFQPADPARDNGEEPDADGQLDAGGISSQDPVTDTDMDATGLYQDGIADEALPERPRADSGVVDYNPEDDEVGAS